ASGLAASAGPRVPVFSYYRLGFGSRGGRGGANERLRTEQVVRARDSCRVAVQSCSLSGTLREAYDATTNDGAVGYRRCQWACGAHKNVKLKRRANKTLIMSTVSPATLVPSPGEGSEPPDLEFACPLCCGELPPSKVTTISSCGHQGCNPCFATWIERHEQSGKTSAPECPFCRTPLSDGDVVQVLGRPFAPRDALLKPPPEEEIDELTLAWLHDNTVLCPGCGIRTNKTEGCDHITCLCGYQFCYSCGQAACQCRYRTRMTFGNEDFDATAMRDEAGIFDYRQTLRRREVRMERDRRRSNVEGEQLLRWRLLRGKPSHDSAAHTCTGSWIFSYPTARKSLTALRGKVQSQLNPEVRLRRGKRYFNLRRDMFLRWNYFRPNRLPVTGSWLFHANNKAGIRCLEREMAVFSQAENIDREIERRKVSARKLKSSREKERQRSQREVEPSWLFLKKGEDVRCLHKMCCSNASCFICHGSEDEQLAQNLASVRFLFG
ncbi:hypothetical protein THAOC_32352, partial [Thalassiosira oceanica]